MKQESTISQLAATLKDVRDNSRDFALTVAGLDRMSAVNLAEPIDLNAVIAATEERKAAAKNGLGIRLQNGSAHTFEPTNWAHSQIAQYTDIPSAYYSRIRGENPDLLVRSVNHGFERAREAAKVQRRGGGRLVRVHKDRLRAFVSDSYRRLDNHSLAETILPVLVDLGFDLGEGVINSYALTDQRLYIKVSTPRVQGEVKKGDVVQMGILVSNSDVGAGSLRVEPFLLRLACTNGMVMESALRKAHLGGSRQAGDDIEEMLKDATKSLSDQAFFAQVRDVVEASASPEFFEREMNKLREADKQPITNFELPKIVERTLKEIGISAGEKVKESILDNLASGAHGAGMNKYGLAQAVTWAAGNAEGLDYDAATELERAGSKVIAMSGKAWEGINAK